MSDRNSPLGRAAVAAHFLASLALSCGGSSGAGGASAAGASAGANPGAGSGASHPGAGSGASGAVNGSGAGASSGGTGAGVTSSCIVGTQGCLCDSIGGCAPGLACSPRLGGPGSVCCSGSNCGAASSGSIGSSCGAVTAAASCTPGITIPAASGTNDSCGYSVSSFNESATLCAINAVGGGAQPAIVQVFYQDEHALTLGCATPSRPVATLPSDPAAVYYPETGDPACVDALGRPLRPVLYVTDITADPTCTGGDLQKGGTAYDPIAIFGTWKSATEGSGNVGTPLPSDPMTKNQWNLGSSADAVPASASRCTENGYGAELRFEIALVSGHSYRFQVIVHDGDQNKGGDSGEACASFCAGSGSLCAPGVAVCGAEGAAPCLEGTSCIDGCCVPAETPSTPNALDASFAPPR